MNETRSRQKPRTAPPLAASGRATPAPPRPRTDPPLVLPVAPDYPSRLHLLIPAGVRNLLADWGWWQNPIPLIPSDHLTQTLAVLERYGWARSLDFSPTGRMCIRGAQTLLETTGHVTPASRARAVDYMQQTLQEHGVHEQFHAWNDHTERTFPQVSHLITLSAHTARKNGE
ncbi:hypothetical protein P1P75_40930 [Streptomyces sp. ID05-39B]|uniref:DUF6197 family protein n=1 Tax=Streptomyces sp. ID05-39B TaxID=3028664 RepID=UPI0029BA0746|nr:hypothetical protein [Streptomyces sp. ID05-39B]MDX3532593.1 hypothetical protein [Streptomyces sp. ID05-39B]